jgi:hypothetical protein
MLERQVVGDRKNFTTLISGTISIIADGLQRLSSCCQQQ